MVAVCWYHPPSSKLASMEIDVDLDYPCLLVRVASSSVDHHRHFSSLALALKGKCVMALVYSILLVYLTLPAINLSLQVMLTSSFVADAKTVCQQ